MVRSFIGFLIIIAIFLTGMVVGIGKDSQQADHDSIKLIDFNLDHQNESEQMKKENEYEDTSHAKDEYETPRHLTQVIASSLESIVKGVCDMIVQRSEEHTSELQSRFDLVCRLLL